MVTVYPTKRYESSEKAVRSERIDRKKQEKTRMVGYSGVGQCVIG